MVGAAVGATVGGTVGTLEGLMEGTTTGEAVGTAVGIFVGCAFPPEQPQPAQSPEAVQENIAQVLPPAYFGPVVSTGEQSAFVLHAFPPDKHPLLAP
jgi:hypothetical protein